MTSKFLTLQYMLFLVCACVQLLSHVSLFETPWTVAPPGSSVHGILQAGILEWVAKPSSVLFSS